MFEHHTLDKIDLAIVLGYFLCAMAAGFYFRRQASQGIGDFFLGGRKVPWWVLGMSGTASNFDMTGTMVMTSFVFALGLQGVWVSMRGGMCLPLGVLMIFMGKWLRRSEVMTSAEWMELRFGKQRAGRVARLLSAVSNLVVTVAFTVYFIKGTGKFLSVFLPFSPEICAVLLVSVAVLYTSLSGLLGVLYTDVVQEILMVGVSCYMGYLAFTLPGHSQLMISAGESWSSFVPIWRAEPMNWLTNPHIYEMFGLCIVFWVARGLFEGAGGFTGGYMAQRYYAARNDRETSLLTAQWTLLLLFRWALIVGAALVALDLCRQDPRIAKLLASDPEKVLPVVVFQALPTGLRGLLLAGLVAAAMSTFDSTINAGASYWVRDFYQLYLNREASERVLIRQSRYATVLIAATGLAMALSVSNIEAIWSWITGPLSAGLFAPVLLRWYWWRFNGWGFAFSTAAGLLTALGLRFTTQDWPIYATFPVVWSISLLAGIITSLTTAPTDGATLINFARKIQPFGKWRAVWQAHGETKSDHTGPFYVLSALVAIAWHLSGVAGVISLVLHKWSSLIVSIALFAGTGVVVTKILNRSR